MNRQDSDHESSGAGRAGSTELPDLAALAGLLADRTRAAMCMALLDGGAWTAGDLAAYASVAPSTATEHLNLLVAGGLLAEERQGRRRYVRLAGPDTAETLENLAALAPYRPVPVRSLAEANHRRALHRARVCYDHIAGRLGVAIADAMAERALLARELAQGDAPCEVALTRDGASWLAALGVVYAVPPVAHRAHVRLCPDWTARRHHLAGAVGAALYRHALERDWVRRCGGTRLLAVTEAGRAAFGSQLGLGEGELGAQEAPRA